MKLKISSYKFCLANFTAQMEYMYPSSLSCKYHIYFCLLPSALSISEEQNKTQQLFNGVRHAENGLLVILIAMAIVIQRLEMPLGASRPYMLLHYPLQHLIAYFIIE